MYKSLGIIKLKDGSTMKIGQVLTPDEEWGPRILSFYKPHKTEMSFWHIEKGVEEKELEGLVNYFYIAHRDSELLGILNIAEHNGCAQYGHVLTKPECRGNGICNAIMRAAMDDFQARSGKMLILCTIMPDAYHIYEKFGFVPVGDKPFIPGAPIMMVYYTKSVDEDAFYKEYFAPAETFVREPQFKDWAALSVLTLTKNAPPLRSLCTDTKTYGRFELHTRELIHDIRILEKPITARVLESKNTGASAGFLITRPDPRFDNQVRMMDFFVHPNFIDSAEKLLSSIELGEGKIQVYLDHTSEKIKKVLAGAGFHKDAELKKQFKYAKEWYDVIIMARE